MTMDPQQPAQVEAASDPPGRPAVGAPPETLPRVPIHLTIVDERAVSPRRGVDFERLAKIAALASAAVGAVVGVFTLTSAISKYDAEAKKAVLEAQRLRIEDAEKSKDSQMELVAAPFAAHDPGWYVVTATIHRTNSGTKTMIVRRTRFACEYADASDFTGATGDASATLVSTPVSSKADPKVGLQWKPLGDAVVYPLVRGSAADFLGVHQSNWNESSNVVERVERYQPNGVGIYMSGEVFTAVHQLVAHFSKTVAVGCHAEVEYSTDDRTRDEIAAEPISSSTKVYVDPFVNTVLGVCGTKDCPPSVPPPASTCVPICPPGGGK